MEILVYDLFAGGGGVTTGIHRASFKGRQIAKVIAAVNHDPVCIQSHEANHPDVMHFIEDIRTLDLSKLPVIEDRGDKLVVLWASLECTNFSNAKGGKPRDADSRTLAEHLFRYIDHIDPDYINIENVREFMSWGPLDEYGKPISRQKGEDYQRWVDAICSQGYEYDYRILNSADFGAHTSRRRYFGMFAKEGLPLIFPEPTHTKNNYRPAKEKINLNEEGSSIFNRSKPLSPKTLNRIAYGIDKFVLNGEGKNFLISYYGASQGAQSLTEPLPTITTKDRHAMISVDNEHNVHSEQFLLEFYGRDNAVTSIEDPAKTIPTNNRMSLVTTAIHEARKQFIEQKYSGPSNVASIDAPLPCITTTPKSYLITVLKELGIIKDIKMRMLTVQELKDITGFDPDYILLGNQAQQKKMIGNAVVPIMAQKWFEAMYLANYGYEMGMDAA